MKDKIFFWEVLFLIWSFPQKNLANEAQEKGVKTEELKTQGQIQLHCSSVFVVNSEYVSHFVLISGSHSKLLAAYLSFYRFSVLED